MAESAAENAPELELLIRKVTIDDLDLVNDLDARITGVDKLEYWRDMIDRFGTRRADERFFLIAKPCSDIVECPALGIIIGEIRGWEFGSDPCGWIFTATVDSNYREQGIGVQLFKAICDEFRKVGTETVRTMVRRNDQVNMSFFRSEGMTAGPYTQLEINLNER
jgi:ribosomal protein S18 acetylase RimI-like enzyme